MTSDGEVVRIFWVDAVGPAQATLTNLVTAIRTCSRCTAIVSDGRR